MFELNYETTGFIIGLPLHYNQPATRQPENAIMLSPNQKVSSLFV